MSTPDRLDVRFASGDADCAAWLFLPDGDGPHAVVVLGHGLGGVKELRLDAFAQRFRAAGYAALVFDYRHFGNSGGQPRQLLDIGRQLQDWASALAWVRSDPRFDAGRIVLWGTSFGGGHVGLTASRDHGVAAVVAQCPFTDGIASARVKDKVSALRTGVRAFRDLVGSALGREPVMIATYGPPRSAALMSAPGTIEGHRALVPPGYSERGEVAARFGLQITRHRPGRRFGDIACPALFVLCDRDNLAPADAAAKHAARAPRAEIVHLDRGHFDIYVGDGFEEAVAIELDFLRRHVPADSPP